MDNAYVTLVACGYCHEDVEVEGNVWDHMSVIRNCPHCNKKISLSYDYMWCDNSDGDGVEEVGWFYFEKEE